jgi:parallel beta-helix repeat protein
MPCHLSPGDRRSAARCRSFLLALLSLCATAGAATYYVDPATGQMSNPGTATQPWSTLEAVFTANKTFAAGDVIRLRSGYHGFPQVKGSNSGVVTIRPEDGHTPKVSRLIVRNGSRWSIEGLDVCPEHAGAGLYQDTNIVDLQSSGSFVTLRNCVVRAAFDTTGWTVANWQDRAGNGIWVQGPDAVLVGNRCENVGYGIRVRKSGPRALVSRNVIKSFCMDAIVALGDDGTYEYNTVTGSHVADSNHDDFLQSWSTDAAGTVGAGTIYRVTVRGNVFISRTLANQPLATEPMGISCFDGMFEGWVIENNLVVSNVGNGIVINGAVNCRIVNNTAVENPLSPAGSRPFIKIVQHNDYTDGSSFPPTSRGNLIRNNISSATQSMVAGGGSFDHNVNTTAYSTWFTNHLALDFTLKPGSPGVGAGLADSAPAIDLRELPRTVPYDLGAYETQATTQDPYQQWLIAHGLPADGSGSGAPDASPSGDGVPNEMKFALGLPVNSKGYEGRLIPGRVVVDGKSYNSLTYIRPEPAPAGVDYAVKVSSDLVSWSATPVIQVSSVVEGSLRRVTVRDSVPVTAGGSRFMRLEVSR